jgi:hypothetical protein
MHPFDSPFSMRRAGRMAIAPVLKTGVRKGMGVRIPRSPPLKIVQIKDLLLDLRAGRAWITNWVTKRY